jgi:hypothetical protein
MTANLLRYFPVGMRLEERDQPACAGRLPECEPRIFSAMVAPISTLNQPTRLE